MQEKNEDIVFRLLNVKSVGWASISYWNIIVTNAKVYFFQKGVNPAPLALGAFAEIFYLFGKKKEVNQPLSSFFEQSSKVIQVESSQLKNIDLKSGFFRGRLLLFTAEKKYKFKFSKKNALLLQQAIGAIKN